MSSSGLELGYAELTFGQHWCVRELPLRPIFAGGPGKGNCGPGPSRDLLGLGVFVAAQRFDPWRLPAAATTTGSSAGSGRSQCQAASASRDGDGAAFEVCRDTFELPTLRCCSMSSTARKSRGCKCTLWRVGAPISKRRCAWFDGVSPVLR